MNHHGLITLPILKVLMSAPNPDDPLANDVAEIWTRNEKQALETAKKWTALYAK